MKICGGGLTVADFVLKFIRNSTHFSFLSAFGDFDLGRGTDAENLGHLVRFCPIRRVFSNRIIILTSITPA